MSLSDKIVVQLRLNLDEQVVKVSRLKEAVKELKALTLTTDYNENEGGDNETHNIIDSIFGDKLT